MKDVIVKAQIRNIVDKYDEKRKVNISNDFFVELSKKVEETILDSCKRARANGRNTVMGKDL